MHLLLSRRRCIPNGSEPFACGLGESARDWGSTFCKFAERRGTPCAGICSQYRSLRWTANKHCQHPAAALNATTVSKVCMGAGRNCKKLKFRNFHKKTNLSTFTNSPCLCIRLALAHVWSMYRFIELPASTAGFQRMSGLLLL